MKSARALEELAKRHDVPTTRRRFLEVLKDGKTETTFIDLPRPRDEIIQALRDKGALPRT